MRVACMDGDGLGGLGGRLNPAASYGHVDALNFIGDSPGIRVGCDDRVRLEIVDVLAHG